jgi:hypothetical protein
MELGSADKLLTETFSTGKISHFTAQLLSIALLIG